MSLFQLKQLYFNLKFPLISYPILAWRSADQYFKDQQSASKKNKVIKAMYFAVTHRKNTESAPGGLGCAGVGLHRLLPAQHVKIKLMNGGGRFVLSLF